MRDKERIQQKWKMRRKKNLQPAHTQQTQQANLQAVVDFLIIELYIHEYSTSKDNYRTYYRPSQTVRAPLTTVSTATTSNHFRNKVNAPNQDIYDVTFALIVSRTVRKRAWDLSCLVFISCYANRLLFLLFFLVDTLPDVVGPCVFVLLCCRLFHSSIVCCLSCIDILYHAYFRLWPNSCNGTKHSLFGTVWCVYVIFFIILLSIFISYSHIRTDCFSLVSFLLVHFAPRTVQSANLQTNPDKHTYRWFFFVSAQTFPCALNRSSDGNFQNSKPITKFLR